MEVGKGGNTPENGVQALIRAGRYDGSKGGGGKNLKYVISNKTHNINDGFKVIYRKIVNNDRPRFFIRSVYTRPIKSIRKGLEKEREAGTSQSSRVKWVVQ